MQEQVVYTSVDRATLDDFIRGLPATLSGRAPDPHGIAAGFRARLAFTFLGLVKEAFETKGRGGTGSDGITWAPLTQSTIKAKLRKGMTKAQSKRYRQDFIGAFKSASARMSEEKARKFAHFKATRAHEIRVGRLVQSGPYQALVDTGILRQSLSVGTLVENGPAATYSPADQDQVFEEAPGEVLIGSSVPYAVYQHRGTRRIPARPFWPNQLPDQWGEEITRQTSLGLQRIVDLVVQL